MSLPPHKSVEKWALTLVSSDLKNTAHVFTRSRRLLGQSYIFSGSKSRLGFVESHVSVSIHKCIKNLRSLLLQVNILNCPALLERLTAKGALQPTGRGGGGGGETPAQPERRLTRTLPFVRCLFLPPMAAATTAPSTRKPPARGRGSQFPGRMEEAKGGSERNCGGAAGVASLPRQQRSRRDRPRAHRH